ncbi:MAG: METTL5 family protein [Candidatus Kariarchaeaceae archaeon]
MSKMNRKNLEIILSKNLEGFVNPNVKLEQYMTPPRVAANLIHRAYELGDIDGKSIVDVCAGTGILSIAATLFGGNVTAIEIDSNAIEVMKNNMMTTEVNFEIINSDALDYNSTEFFDTAVLNPPFGIQQKKFKDIDFINKAHQMAKVVYCIVDGSLENQKQLPKILKKIDIEILEMYRDEFPISKSYPWHKYNRKIHSVLILRTIKY